MKTNFRRAIVLLGMFGLMLGLASRSHAQDWPTKPVTLVVPFAPGGGADIVARILAMDVSKRLGQQVIVDFRPGANGTVGTGTVTRAAPDGYTLVLVPAGPIINSKLLYKSLAYDPDRDLTPIMKLVESPFALMAYPPKHQNVQNLIAFAKANPSQINVGAAGNGSAGHLLALMIEANTGARFNIVPYKGSGQMVSEIMTGRLDMTVDYPSAYIGQIEAKSIRVLATLGETRSPLFPDAPTMKESGFPGVVGTGWFSLLAPAGVPEALVAKIHSAFSETLRTPSVVTQLSGRGYTTATGSPAELKALMASESAKLATLIKTANISLE